MAYAKPSDNAGFRHEQEISVAVDEFLTQRPPGVEIISEVHGSQQNDAMMLGHHHGGAHRAVLILGVAIFAFADWLR